MSQLFGNPSLISRVIKSLSRVVYRGLLGSIFWLGISSLMDNSLHLYCGECRCLAGRWSAKWSGLQHWLWLGCVMVNVWGLWFIQGWPWCSSIPAERHFVDFVLWSCQPTDMWLAHKPSILLLKAKKINRKDVVIRKKKTVISTLYLKETSKVHPKMKIQSFTHPHLV